MRRIPALAALVLLLACPLARGDITLSGAQHIGDCKPKGVSCAAFTQTDPVTRDFMFSKPVNFHVSTLVMLDKVRLNNPEDLGNQLQVYLELQGTGFTSSRFGVLSGDTFDLIPDIPLAAGHYSLLPDGGCTVNNNEGSPNGFYSGCSGGEDNDFGFSSITLITNPTTDVGTSVMFNRRRHIGDSNETGGSNVGYAGRWYPDDPDTLTLDLGFTLSANSRLDSVEFYRLRDVGAGLQRATVSVDGIAIGTLTQDALQPNPAFIDTGLLLLSGSHTLRIQMPDPGDADDVSWDDILLLFADTTTSGTVGFFNAVDVGDNALTGKLRTKVAGGGPYTLDLYAMNGFGTGTNVTYNGNATVEVLDSGVTTGLQDIYGCHASWTVAQSLGSVMFSGGKAQVPIPAFLGAGLQNARIRVTDSTTQARGCSLDNFAIRPNSFNVVPSHGTETTAGTAAALTNTATAGLPRHKAGWPFTITATATAANGTTTATSYNGTPDLTRAVLAPATVAGTISTANWTSAGPGVRRTEVTYSEVGAVTLTVKDITWANVDAGDTAEADRTIVGTANAGRFIPDHFNVTDGTLAPACAAGGFSYLGDTLNWATPAVTLTAVNAANVTTQNYATGTFESLPATLATPAYAALTGTIGEAPPATPTIGATVAGVATVTLPALKFTRTRTGVFDAEIAVTLPVFDDDDDVAPSESPIVLGAPTAGNGVAFSGNAKSQRFGRLYFEPAYGSERLPMAVPLRAEYFDGTTFVPNTADLCTSVITSNVTLVPLGGQTHTVAGSGSGRWTVTLTAPNVPGQAVLSIDDVLFPTLAADNDGNDVYDEDPTVTVTFGVYSEDQRRIFQREVVGN